MIKVKIDGGEEIVVQHQVAITIACDQPRGETNVERVTYVVRDQGLKVMFNDQEGFSESGEMPHECIVPGILQLS
jgi:hypothetical protein